MPRFPPPQCPPVVTTDQLADAVTRTPAPDLDRLAGLRAELRLADDRVLLAHADEDRERFQATCDLIRTPPPGDSREAADLSPDSGRWEPALGWRRYWLLYDAAFFGGLLAALAGALAFARWLR